MGIQLQSNSLKTTLKGMNDFEAKILSALETVSKSAASQMQAYAQQNAKWTDRTGNARQKLTGDAYWVDPKTLETVICHQVDYGVWLELAMGRKYAILEQSLNKVVPDLIDAYKKLVGDII